MKILSKNLFPLKNGHLFAVLEVTGRKGERLSLAEQGISRPLIFFHEAPDSMVECSYFKEQKCIELGGAEQESERTLYLITDKE
ncbi:MAG: hypothetical protein JW744_00375 [Candidatus Diapherotrites archaeon]|uniref:Uncharacterized protein n=1 Tax=Candidatus Iainarchaeum sp. TaxID=3101447 RepID=A0A939C9P4_9ARCH|nr:hypothetical protein [Candidatus Diapherotrites archaeon]